MGSALDDIMNTCEPTKELGLSSRDWAALFDAVYYQRLKTDTDNDEMRKEIRDLNDGLHLIKNERDQLRRDMVELRGEKLLDNIEMEDKDKVEV